MAVYQSYTLQDLQLRMAEKYDSSIFWTADEATDAINEALLMWNLLTGFWKDTITITTTNGNWDYALPSSIVFGMRVEYDGKPLGFASMQDMDNGKPGWQGQTTTSGGSVPTTVSKWLPLSIDMIAIWPADEGGHTLTVDGVSATPKLVDLTDFIDIGAEALNVILGYALHALALKEGGDRFEGTMPYFLQFLSEAAEENDQLTQSSIFREFIGSDETRKAFPTRGMPTNYDSLGGRQP